jgi:hypothetical protein
LALGKKSEQLSTDGKGGFDVCRKFFGVSEIFRVSVSSAKQAALDTLEAKRVFSLRYLKGTDRRKENNMRERDVRVHFTYEITKNYKKTIRPKT